MRKNIAVFSGRCVSRRPSKPTPNSTKRFINGLHIAVLILGILGCAPDSTPDLNGETLEILRTNILADRGPAARTTQFTARDISELLYQYIHLADDETIDKLQFTGKQPTNLISQRVFLRGKVTRDQAIEDVALLFQGFKYGYCLYGYFGGDAVFNAAEASIVTSIDNATTNGAISISALRTNILDRIDFIQDGHAVFAAQPLFRREFFYFNDTMHLGYDENGYFRIGGDRKLYLESIDGAPPEEAVKISLNAKGELVYIVGVLRADQGRRIRINMTFENEENVIQRTVTLRRKSTLNLLREITYRNDTRDGIPVITNRNTAPSTEKMRESLSRFLNDAEPLSHHKAVVLDLRGHAGGQWDPALHWVESFVGGDVQYEQHDASLRSRTSIALHKSFVEWYQRDNEARRISSITSLLRQKAELRNFDPETDTVWQLRDFEDSQIELLPNDTLVFTLIDRNTGSAGEDFVHFLRQIENVIFIGENTKGLIISGSPAWGTLPNSGLSFQIPVDMTITSEGPDIEGVGFLPDLWVDPDRAMDRVFSLLERVLP